MRPGGPAFTLAQLGNHTTVVSVHGELDLAAADELRDALSDGSSEEGTNRLIVDLVGTTFLDSTALSVMAAAAKALEAAGGSLTVVADDPRILRILRLTGLDRTIRVERSLAEAVARLLAPA
jgi:anti-sigma B factor antagonist